MRITYKVSCSRCPYSEAQRLLPIDARALWGSQCKECRKGYLDVEKVREGG